MIQNIQIVILGLTLGGVFALMASGLTLIFGVMGIVNLAHAAFMVLAAFISFFAFQLVGLDPILSIVITMPVMFVVGLIVYRLFFARSVADPHKRAHWCSSPSRWHWRWKARSASCSPTSTGRPARPMPRRRSCSARSTCRRGSSTRR